MHQGDASVPAIYLEAFDVVEPTGSGEVSLGVLIRVLRSSQIPAPTIDKVNALVRLQRYYRFVERVSHWLDREYC